MYIPSRHKRLFLFPVFRLVPVALFRMSQASNKKVLEDNDPDETIAQLERRLEEVRARKKAKLLNSPSSAPPTSASSSPRLPSRQFGDSDVIKKEYRFIRSEQDDEEAETSWEKKIAKTYSDHLYKEFALADMSRHEEGKVCRVLISVIRMPID